MRGLRIKRRRPAGRRRSCSGIGSQFPTAIKRFCVPLARGDGRRNEVGRDEQRIDGSHQRRHGATIRGHATVSIVESESGVR
jgi:hypothetical protein